MLMLVSCLIVGPSRASFGVLVFLAMAAQLEQLFFMGLKSNVHCSRLAYIIIYNFCNGRKRYRTQHQRGIMQYTRCRRTRLMKNRTVYIATLQASPNFRT